MTMTDSVDLFSPALRRQRIVDWQAPGPVAKAAAG
ncbi:MAG TPA: PaaI family thioesterase, partial [Bradyrhizobium sp.]